MSEVITIGLNIAKNGFHAHGADAGEQVVFSRRLTRTKLLDFFASHPGCNRSPGWPKGLAGSVSW